MEQDTHAPLSLDEVNARMGWTITEEGKSRARAELDQATEVDWDTLRARVGLSPTAA
jgi:hypothetical protein